MGDPIMGAYQRRKGAAGELEWVHFLRVQGFTAAERQLGQARDGGGDVRVKPFLYEVKRHHKLAVRKFLDQAVQSVVSYNQGEIPVVALREDGRGKDDWMVLMRADDFFNILKERK